MVHDILVIFLIVTVFVYISDVKTMEDYLDDDNNTALIICGVVVVVLILMMVGIASAWYLSEQFFLFTLRKIWRYQIGNQKPIIFNKTENTMTEQKGQKKQAIQHRRK